jgi:hypothetical protein
VLGLPYPDVEGYSYTIRNGIVRTAFDDGTFRQRRQYTHWPRTWNLQFTINVDTWHTMSGFLAVAGSNWFTMPLVSGESSDVADHTVRLLGGPVVTADYQQLIVNLAVEQETGTTPSSPAIPTAQIDSYSFEEDYGFIRTPFENALFRQSQKYSNRPRRFNVTWRAKTLAELAETESWLNTYGYTWSSVELLSGETGRAWYPTTHTVRVISDPTVTLVGPTVADVSVVFEQACANESLAFQNETGDYTSQCLSKLTLEMPLGLNDAALAAAWGPLITP